MPPLKDPITPERWAEFVEVYQEIGGPRHVVASKRVGITYDTLRKYYTKGLPPDYKPLGELVVYPNLEAAKAKKAQLDVVSRIVDTPSTAENPPPPPPADDPPRNEETETAKPDPKPSTELTKVEPTTPAGAMAEVNAALAEIHSGFAKALRREGQLVTLSREIAIGGQSMVVTILKGFEPVLAAVARRLVLLADDPTLKSAMRTLSALDRVAKVANNFSKLTDKALQQQRLIAGMPQQIKAVQGSAPTDGMASLEGALALLGQVQRTRAEAAKVIDVPARRYEGEEGGDD